MYFWGKILKLLLGVSKTPNSEAYVAPVYKAT